MGGPDGDSVPLWTFDTPEHAFAPHPQLDHKLIMLPFLYAEDGRPTQIVHQADSIRHLRCMKSDVAPVEATPFETYVAGPMGTARLNDCANPKIPNRADLHAALWTVFARRMPEGTVVTVINVISKAELNGRTGKVVRVAAADDVAARIGVLVDGMDGPIRLKPNCVKIKQRVAHVRPYSCLEALLKKHTDFDDAKKEIDLEEFTAISVMTQGLLSCSLWCLRCYNRWTTPSHSCRATQAVAASKVDIFRVCLSPVALWRRLIPPPPGCAADRASHTWLSTNTVPRLLSPSVGTAPSEERGKAACGQPVGRVDQGDREHAVG